MRESIEIEREIARAFPNDTALKDMFLCIRRLEAALERITVLTSAGLSVAPPNDDDRTHILAGIESVAEIAHKEAREMTDAKQ